MVISDDDEVDHRPSKKRTFAELDREDDITAYVDSVIAGVWHEIAVVADDMEGVEDRMDQSDTLVDTWLQKNVTAEGEVMVLRERVEAQEILIGELQHRLARAEALIKALVHTEMHPARVSREPVDLPALAVAGPSNTTPEQRTPASTPAPQVPAIQDMPAAVQDMPAARVMPEPELAADMPAPGTLALLPAPEAAPEAMPAPDEMPAPQEMLACEEMPAPQEMPTPAEMPAPEEMPGPTNVANAQAMPPSLEPAPEVLPAPPSSTVLPPPLIPSTPATVDMPSVQLLPPTPSTSQEAANYTATTLLQVPVLPSMADISRPPASPSTTATRSRSQSPAIDRSDLCRSPHLTPTSNKCIGDDSLPEPATKKQRQG
ncbi:hypothetical protein BYT27DRAFT_7210312 [Phlegmacium glaucopus]|nr:hypothetical protein BYT27DRAFT_7210312 [Phlegmacium glaucopus]